MNRLAPRLPYSPEAIATMERFEQHLREIKCAPSTIELRLVQVRVLVREFSNLRQVDVDELRALLHRRYGDRHPETYNSAVRSYAMFFGWALSAGMVLENPTIGLERMRIVKGEIKLAPARRAARHEDDPMIVRFRRHLESKRRSAQTIRLRLHYLRMFAAEAGDLTEATPAQLDAFLEARQEDWSDETLNACISSLRAFYSWAHQRDHITTNPSRYLEAVSIVPKVAPIATDEAVRQALKVATLQERAIILLARECGLRRMEIATLSTTDRTGEWLRVVGKGLKVARKHLEPQLLELLEGIEEKQGAGYYFRSRFFGHPDDHVSAAYVYETLKRLVGVSPHALRHAAATAVFNQTKNIRLTQEFLGHASIRTTQNYVHVGDDDLELASAASRI